MMTKPKRPSARAMTLVEVMISMTIVVFVIAGTMVATLAFLKYSNTLSARSDLSYDLRLGIEKIAYDARNASQVSARTQNSFTLTVPGDGAVTYSINQSSNTITRTSGGSTTVIMNNVDSWDILTSAVDQGGSLVFSENEIAVESLTLGTSSDIAITMTDFTFKIRN